MSLALDWWTEPPLIGRGAELAAINGFLAARRPGVILLCGKPGMGKGRIVAAARAAARGEGWAVLPESDTDLIIRVDAGITLAKLDHRVTVPSLDARGPLLVSLRWDDGTPEVADHLADVAGAVRAGTTPVVLLVAAWSRSGLAPVLAPDVDLTIGPLAAEDVRLALQQVVEDVHPPVEPAELRAYVRCACEQPALLSALARVLPLATGPRSDARPPEEGHG